MMVEGRDFAVARHEDTRYFTVTWHRVLADGTAEDVFCGQAEQKEHDDDWGKAGLWYSGHLPLDTPGFETLGAIAAYLAERRAENPRTCGNCGSAVLVGIEYPYDDPRHYDGVSEWECSHCGRRWDRFTGEVLEEGRKA